MPFDPQAPSEQDRSRTHALIWFGAACALLSLVNRFLGMDNMMAVIAYGGTAGGLLQAALSRASDEYLRGLYNVGWRAMGTGVALYLMALFVFAGGDLSRQAGHWASSGTKPSDGVFDISGFLVDPISLCVILAILFYAGFAFAWLRDRFTTESSA